MATRGKPYRDHLDFMPFRDKYDAKGEPVGNPGQSAYDKFLTALDKWEDGSKPREWGADTVLVIDTLNMASYGAFNAAKMLNRSAKHAKLHYGAAKNALFALSSLLWDDTFKTNIVITSHIKDIAINQRINNEGEFEPVPGSKVKEFPATVGQAMSKEIALFTNELYKIEVRGSGASERRKIITGKDNNMDLGTGTNLPSEIDAEGGLAKIFAVIRGDK
jgi:hypothetical protein